MSNQYKDRFSEGTEDLPDKSAFVCSYCKKKYKREEAEGKKMTCCNRTLKEYLQESFGA
ncbi:MAG TPA: hypothetical protein VJ974_09195 [Geopsychrobacteraceae bacterium]|nr:hypothetical protein [Geopsychrobacteraceae bacterium]